MEPTSRRWNGLLTRSGLPVRDNERLRAHYELEKSLAERLMNSSPQERNQLYGLLYDELFRKISDHPQLQRLVLTDERHRHFKVEVGKLARYCDASSTYLEIGAGDCRLALALSKRVAKVFAVEISRELVKNLRIPNNFQIVIPEGTRIDIAAETVDLAYSNQLIEHLHPDDVEEHFNSVRKCLKPGGRYYLVTPSRWTGPHDISRYFDDVATGLHLKEYTYAELSRLIFDAGFSKILVVLNIKGRIGLYVPLSLMEALERAYALLPTGFRRRLRAVRIIEKLFGIEMLAIK